MGDVEATKKRALRILGKRNFSEREMTKRLIDKGESEEAAGDTVRWLVEMGYISDGDYAALIVGHYTAKGYGQARIKDELYKRGIPHEIWEDVLSVSGDEEQTAPYGAAVELVNKKLRGSNDADDLRRAAEMLVRRGFSYDEARDIIKQYLECE